MKRICLLLILNLIIQNINGQDANQWYRKVDRTGYINKQGEELTFTDNIFSLRKFVNGYAVITITKVIDEYEYNGKTYYDEEYHDYVIDTNGKIVIDFKELNLKDVAAFYNGLFAATTLSGMNGFLNIKGDWVISPVYSYAASFNNDRTVVRLKGKYYWINIKGEIVNRNLSNGKIFYGNLSEGLARGNNKDGKKYPNEGYVNKGGNIVIPFIYEYARDFSEGVAVVAEKFNGWRYFIDKNGKKVEQIPKAVYYSSFGNGLALVQKDGKVGYVNHDGEMVIPNIYEYGTPFVDGYAAVTFKEPKMHNNPKLFSEGFFTSNSGTGMYIIINTKGEQVSDTEYYHIPNLLTDGVAKVLIQMEDGQVYYALIDLDHGEKIFDAGKPFEPFKRKE